MLKPEYASWREVMKDDFGRYRTATLFWELRRKEMGRVDRYPPLFTLKDKPFEHEGVVYPSLKAIYMSYDHIPGFEYDFAMDVFGNWDHWEKLQRSVIADDIKAWRTELEIRIKADAMKTVLAQSRDTDKGLAAARALLAGEDKGTKRGRPSKEEVARQQKIEAGVRETLAEDIERLGLTLIKSK